MLTKSYQGAVTNRRKRSNFGIKIIPAQGIEDSLNSRYHGHFQVRIADQHDGVHIQNLAEA